MKKVIIALTTIVLIATAAIGITHYYSVKILSASRAYTNFEAQYSRGEKDATRHLLNYIYSHEETDYQYFKNDISIPKGDSIAREALVAGKDIRIARLGFLMAGNHREDLPELIWFFQKFKNTAIFKNAIQTWQQADVMVAQLNALGNLAYKNIKSGKKFDRESLVLQINILSDNLTIKQQTFSALLGATSRMVDQKVFVADMVIYTVILLCTVLLAGIMLRKLHSSKKVIMDQNRALRNMNERVNNFVYTVTHDLRSPLTSLSGLVSVLEKEKDITKVSTYTEMMRESIQIQDTYIKDVLQTIRDGNKFEVCNLGEIVNDVISQNSFFPEGQRVKFLSDLEVWELKCNVTDLKTVFNNLISNAVKYADFSKPEQWVKVRSYKRNKYCVIEIEDNGIGIKPEQKGNIFNKFFKSGLNKKSMGLGLYFAKQAIEDMNGTITVRSLLGGGTSFIVSLPL
ncbi:HAMP domain-containing histidine kinase [Mucilaginibacter sp. BJC16-A38]|uniref:sensor histidine kinase n=1 Tax=Mucilaginibacter phenanthrenivorans TaxID=1234842 RepID=UPI002157BC19|nr:HAMP domain-containing sensor histidine kinase [Mucilaginibacter phenanthrenivorans]MCR8561490.1 HAMP domain-containing histidine kinase [Mucilaginibacter phenanthrenivorans]